MHVCNQVCDATFVLHWFIDAMLTQCDAMHLAFIFAGQAMLAITHVEAYMVCLVHSEDLHVMHGFTPID